jgi:NADH dehydrogenase
MKVAITGGYGLVGAALAKLLRAQGHEAVQLSRRSGADVAERDSLAKAMQGCDAVAHCAGINREIGAQTYDAVHVRGTRNVVEAAKLAGARHISLVSFLRARPGTGWPYHETKWQAEEIVRESGIPYTILKAGVIFGAGYHMLDHLKRALLTFPVFAFVGMKDGDVAPAHVDDVARILAAAPVDERLHNRSFAVIGPEILPLPDAVRRVAAVLGKRRLYFRLPVFAHYPIAWLAERLMKEPMASIAQVRILSEGVAEHAGQADELPDDLKPATPFNEASIRYGLPAAGRYGLRDLRCCRSRARKQAAGV